MSKERTDRQERAKQSARGLIQSLEDELDEAFDAWTDWRWGGDLDDKAHPTEDRLGTVLHQLRWARNVVDALEYELLDQS